MTYNDKMKSRTQSQHEEINRREYPGTRQICSNCDEPTERCEDDGIWSEKLDGWICPDCAKGKNTWMDLESLEEILIKMGAGGFDFDGMDPEQCIQEVKEDIEQLNQIL